ncbi:MAG: hypothetical protein K2L72_01815, partial [Clostridia bacterium]|nr:hypothetical protein [Clostridia bacterium]
GVIVETAKGLEYANVVAPESEVDDSEIVSPLKPIVRIATPRDEEQVKRNRERRGEAIKTAQEKIAARGLGMKLVDCEFAFDGSKVVFFFTAESRVDFRELIKDLSSAFHMRIELRQINVREEIKLTGGYGQCGRECCCIGCMSEPLKSSVKMAKNQGLSLNPAKISGLCGKLMCCLAYENDYYSEACKQVPKVGSEAETPDGKGMVVNVNMLKMLVKVKIEQNDLVTYREFPVDQIRFMRGNVMMGKENFEDDAEEELPEDIQPVKETTGRDRRDKPQERRENKNGNNGGNENRDNRGNRNKNNNNNNRGNNRGENRNNGNDSRNADNRGGNGGNRNKNNGGQPHAAGENKPEGEK